MDFGSRESKIKRVAVIEDVDIREFISQVSTHTEQYSLKFSSNYGLGVNWLITNGQVYVKSFAPVIVFDNHSVEESGYVVGPVESGGLVHIGDRLLRVNNIVLSSLDVIQIPDVINMISSLAESLVELEFEFCDDEAQFSESLQKEELNSAAQQHGRSQDNTRYSGMLGLFLEGYFNIPEVDETLIKRKANQRRLSFAELMHSQAMRRHPYPSQAQVSLIPEGDVHFSSRFINQRAIESLARDLDRYVIHEYLGAYSSFFSDQQFANSLLSTPSNYRRMQELRLLDIDELTSSNQSSQLPLASSSMRKWSYSESADVVYQSIMSWKDYFRDQLMETQFFPSASPLPPSLLKSISIRNKDKKRSAIPCRNTRIKSRRHVFSLSLLKSSSLQLRQDVMIKRNAVILKDQKATMNGRMTLSEKVDEKDDSEACFHWVDRDNGVNNAMDIEVDEEPDEETTAEEELAFRTAFHSLPKTAELSSLLLSNAFDGDARHNRFRGHAIPLTHPNIRELLSCPMEELLQRLHDRLDKYRIVKLTRHSQSARGGAWGASLSSSSSQSRDDSTTTDGVFTSSKELDNTHAHSLAVIHVPSKLPLFLPPIDVTYAIFYSLYHLRGSILMFDESSSISLLKALEKWMSLFDSRSIWEVKKYLWQLGDPESQRAKHQRFFHQSVSAHSSRNNDHRSFYGNRQRSVSMDEKNENYALFHSHDEETIPVRVSLHSSDEERDISTFLRVMSDLATLYFCLKFSAHYTRSNRHSDESINADAMGSVLSFRCRKKKEWSVENGVIPQFHFLPYDLNLSLRSSDKRVCVSSSDTGLLSEERELAAQWEDAVLSWLELHCGVVNVDMALCLCQQWRLVRPLRFLWNGFATLWTAQRTPKSENAHGRLSVDLKPSHYEMDSNNDFDDIDRERKDKCAQLEGELLWGSSMSLTKWMERYHSIFFCSGQYYHEFSEHGLTLCLSLIPLLLRSQYGLAIELLIFRLFPLASPILLKELILQDATYKREDMSGGCSIDPVDENVLLREKTWHDYLSKLIRNRPESCALHCGVPRTVKNKKKSPKGQSSSDRMNILHSDTAHDLTEKIILANERQPTATWDIVNDWLLTSLILASKETDRRVLHAIQATVRSITYSGSRFPHCHINALRTTLELNCSEGIYNELESLSEAMRRERLSAKMSLSAVDAPPPACSKWLLDSSSTALLAEFGENLVQAAAFSVLQSIDAAGSVKKVAGFDKLRRFAELLQRYFTFFNVSPQGPCLHAVPVLRKLVAVAWQESSLSMGSSLSFAVSIDRQQKSFELLCTLIFYRSNKRTVLAVLNMFEETIKLSLSVYFYLSL